MNISMTNLYVRKCKIDYLKFMGVDCLPNYTITPIRISQEEADDKGYATPANVKYDFKTNTHNMNVWTILPTLSADYIMFHEFTHMIDTEKYCKSDPQKYIANKGYTEYHASQVAFMKLLGAESIKSSPSFRMNDRVETYSGNKSINDLIRTPLTTISEIMGRSDFPIDIGAISTVIGLAFNYYGYRSICKLFAEDYAETEDSSSIAALFGDGITNILDKLMLGWFDDFKVSIIDDLCEKLVETLLKKYNFI